MVNAAISALKNAANHLARLASGGRKPPKITRELGGSIYREMTPNELERLLAEVISVRDNANRSIRLLRRRRKQNGV